GEELVHLLQDDGLGRTREGGFAQLLLLHGRDVQDVRLGEVALDPIECRRGDRDAVSSADAPVPIHASFEHRYTTLSLKAKAVASEREGAPIRANISASLLATAASSSPKRSPISRLVRPCVSSLSSSVSASP